MQSPRLPEWKTNLLKKGAYLREIHPHFGGEPDDKNSLIIIPMGEYDVNLSKGGTSQWEEGWRPSTSITLFMRK